MMRLKMENFIKEEVKTLNKKKLTEDKFTKQMKDAVERNFAEKEQIPKEDLRKNHWDQLSSRFDYVVKREFKLYSESCQA